MPVINLILDGEGAWPDLLADPFDVVHLPDATWHLAALKEGMASGRPSLALRLNLPDGRVVVAETSLAAWVFATVALRAQFPDSFAGTPLEQA